MPDGDFKQRLIKHAKRATERAGHASTEAATQQYLILPFFRLLGYDPLDPEEVVPEAHASFSDKFKNRVDYAIMQEGEPVIAVECKKAGGLRDAHQGELRGYFNALPSVRLGILADGLTFEFYSDTRRENLMEDRPFATIDLSAVAQGQVPDSALDALLHLRKNAFDSEDIADRARRKLFIARYADILERSATAPDERLVKAFMDVAGVEHRKTSRLVEEHAEFTRKGVTKFLDKKVLERVGFADREDLVKRDAPEAARGSGAITTETELWVFDYAKRRLSFLCETEDLFAKVPDLFCVDYKTVFAVCYKMERKGKLFNFREGESPRYHFEFLELDREIKTDDLADIDEPLLAMFSQRVDELG